MTEILKKLLSLIPKDVWIFSVLIIIISLLTVNLVKKDRELTTIKAELTTLSSLDRVDTVTVITIKIDTVYFTQKEVLTRIDSVYIYSDTLLTIPFEDAYIKGSIRYKWYNSYLTTDFSYKPKFPLYITESVLSDRMITEYIHVPIYKYRKPTLKFGGGLGYNGSVMGLGSVSVGDKRFVGGLSADGRWMASLIFDF